MSTRAKKKSVLRQNLMAVVKRCNSMERIPSERALAAEFNVSRYLLRRCLSELEQEEIIKKGKRKQGNTMIGYFPWKRRVGIVMADGRNSPYIDYPKILYGVMDYFDKHENFLPQIINFRNFNEFLIKMERYELDYLVWIVSSGDHWEKIKTLSAEQKRKIAFIPNSSLDYDYDCNVVSIDYDRIFDRRIELLIEKGIRSFAYIAANSKYKNRLINKLKDNNIKWDDSMQISEAGEIPECLPGLLEKHKPDAIFCDGAFGFYESFFSTIAAQGKSCPLISVNDNWRMRKHLSAFPELSDVSMQCYGLGEARFKLGAMAIELLERACTEKKSPEKQFVQVEPYFTTAASILNSHTNGSN